MNFQEENKVICVLGYKLGKLIELICFKSF